MPGLIRRIGRHVLNGVGLERSGAAGQLRSALEHSDERVSELKRLLAQARAESQSWKAKLHEGTAHLTEQRKLEEERYRTRVAKLEERLKKEISRIEVRDAARQEKLADLREKVLEAERSVRTGRDHLMAIEVKLDVIEGAINVLDRRFRAMTPAGPGASRRGL
jgi:chromosome segregation ATPase